MVEHAQHGAGLLLSRPLSPGPGLPVVVRFAHGPEAVPRESLRDLDGRGWPDLPAPANAEPLSPWQIGASRWLEALRLGTVAHADSDLFTVGREEEVAQLETDLEQTLKAGGACRVFCGAYGVGKSHLLEILARRAEARGLAVSRVVLDRQRVAACRPRRLYREIVEGLVLPGQARRGVAVLEKVLDQAAGRLMKGDLPWEQHPYFSPLLAVWAEASAASRAELLYWIGGGERTANRRLRARLRREVGRDPGAFYAIKDHRTVWNQLTSLVSGLACLIRDSGLAAGLTLILDEAEMCAVESASDQRYGDRTLTGLAAAALGPRRVRRPELLAELGGHSAVRDFPSFHRSRCHLYLALGMATRTTGREVLERLLSKDCFVDLRPLGPTDKAGLLERILMSYKQAFPHFELSTRFAIPLAGLLELRGGGGFTPREIVQQGLAFLDGARLWPGSVESFIEECFTGDG